VTRDSSSSNNNNNDIVIIIIIIIIITRNLDKRVAELEASLCLFFHKRSINACTLDECGRDSSVGLAIRYGLDASGIESR
jgi:hypothetical protein